MHNVVNIDSTLLLSQYYQQCACSWQLGAQQCCNDVFLIIKEMSCLITCMTFLQAHCFHWHNLSIILFNLYFIILFEASVLRAHSATSSNIHHISKLNLHYLFYPAVMQQCASDLPCWMDPLESRSLMMSSCSILTRRLSAAKLYSTCSFWVWGTMAFKITCEVMSVDVSTHCEKTSHTHTHKQMHYSIATTDTGICFLLICVMFSFSVIQFEGLRLSALSC